jgi:outer membrane protein assembly factor BamB
MSRLLGTLPLLAALAASASAQTVKTFPPPVRTAWTPEGCRLAGTTTPALASSAAWRTLHSDLLGTDEVSVAYAPAFHADWVAEADTWNPTGPVFDSAGNLYFVPWRPYEHVILISLDPRDGSRRWAIPNSTAASVGSGTPLVLADPDHPGAEIVYVGVYDHAIAVRTDGTIVWDMPTGLVGDQGVFGINYVPSADALVGLTRDGFVYALDRRTGTPLLSAPYQLPGEPSPPGPPLAASPAVQACAETELRTLADAGTATIAQIVDVLLGNGSEVANYFSVDPATGRLWVAATAPDAEDGTVDGVSSLGALYGLDLVPAAGGTYTVSEACHRSFVGGSASTPGLRKDGTRVYVGDNVGNLIAIDTADCHDAWTLAVGDQIFGSIAVASDNGEIYAARASGILQVFDQGTMGVPGWTGSLDVYDLGPGQQVFNLQLAGIGANGISFHAGPGIKVGTTILPYRTGVGLLDRGTGAVRWFADGLDESVAVMSTGPDGAVYLGNSPLRRLFARCLSLTTLPAVGGIRKFAPERLDLLLRDAVCAAEDRARNATRNRRSCPGSAEADRVQLQELLAQSRNAAARAALDGDLTANEQTQTSRRLGRAERRLAQGKLPIVPFRALCRLLDRTRGG